MAETEMLVGMKFEGEEEEEASALDRQENDRLGKSLRYVLIACSVTDIKQTFLIIQLGWS